MFYLYLSTLHLAMSFHDFYLNLKLILGCHTDNELVMLESIEPELKAFFNFVYSFFIM